MLLYTSWMLPSLAVVSHGLQPSGDANQHVHASVELLNVF